ncbi:MAG: hypothetical protein IPK97_10420 [Ahniella sp.]|nr:hypothetical protein [Ahniella sp.]
MSGYVTANRALWLTVASVLMVATLRLFRTQRLGTGKPWFKRKAKPADRQSQGPRWRATSCGRPRPVGPWAPLAGQYWKQTRFDTRHVLKSVPFQIMVAFGPG